MAEGVRLDLQVGLDTAYLRNQLNTIGTKLGGQTITLPINFDRRDIVTKTKALQKYIGNKTFDIKIESNTLTALANRVKNFKDRLDELKQEDIELKIKTGAIVSLSKRDGAKVMTDLRAAVLGDSKKLLIPTSIKPSITRADVRDFTNAVKSKLSGLSVKVKADLEMSAVRGGAKSQAEIDADVLRGYEAISRMGAERMKGGGVTEAARREQLKQRLSTGEFDISQLRDIGAQLGVKGAGRFRNTQNLIEKIVAEASVEMIKKYLDPQAVMRNPNRGPLQQVLDTFARGMFQMLGMDPAAMKEQAKQKLLPPAINWPAQTPPPRPFTGPSSTGRALPPGAIPAALSGTSFASQKRLVGDILSPSLKEALRGAANAFVDAVRAELNAAVRQVSVRDLGTTAQRALRGGINAPIAGLLPAAGGTTPIGQMRFNAVRTGAFVGDQPFMRAPSVPTPFAGGGAGGGGGVPPRGGGGGFFQGMGGELRRGLGGLNLPGSGTIRELGNEFSEATKQVLLFGTAYKALAFGMAFPREVADAVSQLQSFRNTLEAISPTATEARLSNELILGLVERYNVPLESARQGFAKLYASMEPAGFSGKEISTLFTGISKASATLGLSQDKVDRVVYAFSQMASKGQLMSEEVSGQLGDVIPGALSIMAEAADMGIAEFKKAMEDGEFVGKRFAEVMNNVPTVLEERFGKGAEGASRTFQGAMNNMQNSLKLFYESFEPVAVVFLNNFVTPIAKGLKEASDGLNAFFTGAQAQTFGGEKIAAELNALKPAFQGIIANVQQLMPLVQLLGGAVLQAAKLFTVLAGNPVVGFLVKTYAQALLLTTAFKILSANAIVQTIRSLVSMVVQLVATKQAMLSTQLQMALLTSNAGGLAAAFRSGALAAAGLGAAIKAALLGGVVTGAIVVIDLLIGRIQRLRAESNAVKAAGKGAQSEVKAAYAGGIETGRSAARSKEAEARSASRLSGIYRNLAAGKKISQGDYEFAKGLGAELPGVAKAPGGGYAPMRAMLNKREPAVFTRTYERYSLQQAQRAENIRQGVAAGQRQGEEAAAAQLTRDARSRQIADIKTPGAGGTSTREKEARESRVPLLELELATAERIMEIERQMMTARLAGNELEVIRLEGLKEQVKINEQIAKIKLDKQTPVEEKSLQIQKLLREGDQARLKTSFELEKKIAETLAQIQERTVNIRKAAEEELADKKKYDRLVAEGILPSVAKITVEVERQFAIEQEKLELLRKGIERQIRLLEKQKEATEDAGERLRIEEKLDKLRDKRDTVTGAIGTLPSMSAETIQARVAAQDTEKPVDYLQDAIDETEKNLKRLTDARYQAVEAAGAISSAFGNAFKGLITGSMTAQEALGNMFQSIADSFADMVAQMIAEWIKMQIVGIVKAILSPIASGFSFGGSSGGFGLSNFQMPSYMSGVSIPTGSFASGGIVTGPTLGLVGEGRYNEAIVPLPDGKSIPVQLQYDASRRAVANAENNAGISSVDYEDETSIGGTASSRQSLPSKTAQAVMATRLQVMEQRSLSEKRSEMRQIEEMIAAPSKINFEYQSQVINNVEYVTAEQFQRGMNQAAEKGRALTMGALKNSVKARRQIGI